MNEISEKIPRITERFIPLIITGLIVYGSWVYSYYICWLPDHHRSISVGLIVGNVLWIVLAYSIWAQIVISGPGIQRVITYDDFNGDVPPIFQCDPTGQPLWCSNCQSIKEDKSHHSSRIGRCISRFDHYCTFMGVIIGKDNYKLFIHFIIAFWCYLIYLLISMIVLVPKDHAVNANVIVALIISGFWLLMLSGLIMEHMGYIYWNKTTIDVLENRRNKRQGITEDRHYSVLYNNERHVVSIPSNVYRHWDRGFKNNWTEVMGADWWIPVLESRGKEYGMLYNDEYLISLIKEA
jgi:palmitoyltransferase